MLKIEGEKLEALKEFLEDHKLFIQGVNDLIKAGRLPKYTRKTIFQNLAKAHGFILLELGKGVKFYVKISKVEAFKKILKDSIV